MGKNCSIGQVWCPSILYSMHGYGPLWDVFELSEQRQVESATYQLTQ